MKLIKALTLFGILCGHSINVAAEVSANIGVTSNYMWRGMTQTDDSAAVSGGFDYENESGFAAGIWTSTVDFSGDDAGNETDFYASYSAQAGELEYSIGAIYYRYSEYDDSDFVEATVDFSYRMFSFGGAYLLDSDWDADGDLYYYASTTIELENDFSTSLTLGFIDPDQGETGSYIQLDVAKKDFTLSLVKASNELDAEEDTKIIVSWGTSF